MLIDNVIIKNNLVINGENCNEYITLDNQIDS